MTQFMVSLSILTQARQVPRKLDASRRLVAKLLVSLILCSFVLVS